LIITGVEINISIFTAVICSLQAEYRRIFVTPKDISTTAELIMNAVPK
jgi:hypothetical protein